jgi:hypothetical protein
VNLRRGLVALVLLAGAVLGWASPAHGGGSTWDVEPDVAAPGERVEVGTCVAWAHNGNLGTPEDGPYSMWVSPLGSNGTGGGVAQVPDGAVPVGEITIDEGGLWKNCGPNAAHISFTVPNLPPGEYELIHCNEPCTDVLGDITWGVLTITDAAGSVPAPPPPTTTTVAPTTTTTVVPSTTTVAPTTEPAAEDEDLATNAAVLVSVSTDGQSGSDDTAAWWVGGALGLVAVAGWIAVHQRRSGPA